MIPRALIWLSLLGCGVALSLALGGCAAPQLLKGSGVSADAPAGYVIDCIKSPSQEHCQ
jgi:hypothetical protein